MSSLLALQRDAKPNPVSAARAALDAAEMFDVTGTALEPSATCPPSCCCPCCGHATWFLGRSQV